MTDKRTTHVDTGFPPPTREESQLHQRLLYQQGQLDVLTQTLSKRMVQLCTQPVPLPKAALASYSQSAVYHHASVPEWYKGDPAGLQNFLLACELYFAKLF